MNFKFLLLNILLCLSQFIHAQDTYLRINPEEYELKTDLEKVVHKDILKEINVNEFLKGAIINFQIDHISFNRIRLYSSFLPFLYGNYGSLLSATKIRDPRSDEFKKKLSALKKAVFANKKMFGKIYDVAMPEYMEAFTQMTVPEQQGFLDFFNNAIQYTERFDLATEKAALESMGRKFISEKGNMNAFIFRRIKAGEMSQKDILYWLKKIHADLSAKVKKIETIEDEYLICNEAFYKSNHWAHKFGGPREQTAMKKEGEAYSFLFPRTSVLKKISNYGGKILLEITHSNGSKEFAVAREDYSDGVFEVHKLRGAAKYSYFNIPNSFLIGYEDGRSELFKDYFDKDKSKRIEYMFDKPVGSVYFPSPDFILARCRDNTLIALVINPENGAVKETVVVDEVVNNLKELNNGLVTYNYRRNKQPEIIFVEDGKVVRNKLYYGFKYLDVKKFGERLIFKTETKTGEAYGLLSSDGGLTIKPIYRNAITVGKALFLQQDDDEKPYYALFTSYGHQKTTFAFEFGASGLPDYNKKDKTFILYKNKYEGGKVVDTYSMLIDDEGNTKIRMVNGLIRRLYVPNSSGRNYYYVSKELNIVDGKRVAVGPYAIYNHYGYAETQYIYDEITSHLEPTEEAFNPKKPPVITCIKKGKPSKFKIKK